MSRLNDWFIRYNNLNLIHYTDNELTFYEFNYIIKGEEYGYGTGDGYGSWDGSVEYRTIYEDIPNAFDRVGYFYTDWSGNINGSNKSDE